MNKEIKTKKYEAPKFRVVEVEVEKGFAGSPVQTSYNVDGQNVE